MCKALAFLLASLIASTACGCALAREGPVMQLGDPGSPATAVAWSPDGRYLATGGLDGVVRVWDLRNGMEKAHAREFGRPYSHMSMSGLAFSPDGFLIAFGSADGAVRVWKWQTGEPSRVIARYDMPPTIVAFSADGQRLTSATGGAELKDHRFVPYNSLKVHDVATAAELSSVNALQEAVKLEILPGGNEFAVILGGAKPPLVGVKGAVEVRSSATGAVKFSIPIAPAITGLGLVASPDGSRLLVAGFVLDTTTGETVASDRLGNVFGNTAGTTLIYLERERMRNAQQTVGRARFVRVDVTTGATHDGTWMEDLDQIENTTPEIYSPDRRLVVDRRLRVWPTALD